MIYSITEKELLLCVEILKEYKLILYGRVIHWYTDHLNLTCNLTVHATVRVNLQCLLLSD